MSTTVEADGAGHHDQAITVGETADGDPYTLPVEELLTGRLFATGKSGAGKSNTGSVIAEELLERGHPVLVVDVDGEYWGLKEEYELLHVGATDECDLQVGPEHAGKLAELALEQRVPIILDVSGYVDPDEADTLVQETAHELFAREQDALQPFLLLVEEIHEYLPQQGSLGETGEVLRRIAKRGRKRGLGIAGLSQRPADVDKSFITQADLVVWHRLTWDNDTQVVKRVVGKECADAVSDLDDGEAFVQTDWHEADIERVQFRRKRTFDAGATPGLDDVDRPELKSIEADLVEELEAISDEHDRRQDRIAELEAELDAREARIDELEEELDDARDLQRLGEAFIDAAEDRGGSSEVDRELLAEKNERIHELESDLEAVRGERDGAQDRVATLEDEVERLRSYEERVDQAEAIEEQLEQARDVLGVDVETAETDTATQAELAAARERIEELENRQGLEDVDLESDPLENRKVRTVVRDVESRLSDLGEKERQMLRYYLVSGPASQKEAYKFAGGSPTSGSKWRKTKTLRDAGLVKKVGRGEYDFGLRDHLNEVLSGFSEKEVDRVYDSLESEVYEFVMEGQDD
jgi:DNA helicase HerA-like ATPase